MAALGSAQKDKAARPSPAAKAQLRIGRREKTVTVDYSSPRAKGRKVYGELVPYGDVWRAGANEATTFRYHGGPDGRRESRAGGKLYDFHDSDKDKWTLIISKKTGEWGIPYLPGADSDFARVDMKVSGLPAAVENFTIAFDKSAGGCTLRMDWETTRASVDISRM